MKNFFKKAIASCLILSFAFAFVSCKKKETRQGENTATKYDYAGTWKLTHFKSGKLEVDKPYELGFEVYLIIDKSGKATFVSGGIYSEETDWEFKDDRVEINFENVETIICKIEDNKLAVSCEYNKAEIECVFEKYTGELPKAPIKASDYLGKWKIVSAEAYDVTIDDPANLGLDVTFEFMEDGKASLDIGNEMTEQLDWEEKDDGILIKDDSRSITGKLKDDKLIVEMEEYGVEMIMTFEKQ